MRTFVGAVSSLACVNFALRTTAEDNKDSFPSDVINTLNFCVDDCLKSLPPESTAVAHVENLQH